MKLPSAYQPEKYEGDIYALWENSGVFKPSNRGHDDYYSLTLPPPNANGDLHMGHALTVAIEDSLVRYHRLQGKAALYVPGADHAGFETWVVYEKKLAQEGKSRFDYSREELYRQVWDFVQKNKHNFEAQLRALGASVDWTRFTFTLDNKVIGTSYQTFKKMWEDGLIYRGSRIVNYCTFHGTSFSDIEVVHEEEKTNLWHIAYPLADGSGEVVIATTRPETKVGQAALMVNPKDKRYKHLVGKEVQQPLVPDKNIKIIADEYVNMDFGTGVVTVTPGHDPNDYEVARRNNLPMLELITTEGKLSNNVPQEFRGMTVTVARQTVVEALKKKGLLRKVEDYTHSVGKCYKCGTVIEPLLREQWFVKMQPLATRAIEELKAGKIDFYPKNKKDQIIRYLSELKDWNISRQIPWGIPIPAFQNTEDASDWIFDARVHEESIEVDGKSYKRDPDVFDTWFSSGQWPYVTLDYPSGDDFKSHYPLSLMETGFDILYQWVARMIMLGLYVTGEVPFKTVYLHGMIVDKSGQKQSKSKGNVSSPLEIISEYGSDALRIGILNGQSPGNNQLFMPSKATGGRNFANKLWNIARFVEDKVGDNHHLKSTPTPSSRADHWILSRLNHASTEISKAFEAYRISEAYEVIYSFVWHDLADWYIEASKVQTNPSMLAYLLDSTLKLSHPFAPFVTETIWQTLAWEGDSILADQLWPRPVQFNALAVAEFKSVIGVITEARHITKALGVGRPKLYFNSAPLIEEEGILITLLGRLGGALKAQGSERKGLKLTNSGYDAWLDIDNLAAMNYLSSLREKQVVRQETIKRLQARVSNPSYASKAPKALVEQSHAQIEEEKQLLTSLDTEIKKIVKAIEI
ncbi:valine--tRNA ligase [Candidatus Saccharibacteria bacterium]|nr:valine--tRNA ligase [Candidatus Saccharibacteria bacterium]